MYFQDSFVGDAKGNTSRAPDIEMGSRFTRSSSELGMESFNKQVCLYIYINCSSFTLASFYLQNHFFLSRKLDSSLFVFRYKRSKSKWINSLVYLWSLRYECIQLWLLFILLKPMVLSRLKLHSLFFLWKLFSFLIRKPMRSQNRLPKHLRWRVFLYNAFDYFFLLFFTKRELLY